MLVSQHTIIQYATTQNIQLQLVLPRKLSGFAHYSKNLISLRLLQQLSMLIIRVVVFLLITLLAILVLSTLTFGIILFGSVLSEERQYSSIFLLRRCWQTFLPRLYSLVSLLDFEQNCAFCLFCDTSLRGSIEV